MTLKGVREVNGFGARCAVRWQPTIRPQVMNNINQMERRLKQIVADMRPAKARSAPFGRPSVYEDLRSCSATWSATRPCGPLVRYSIRRDGSSPASMCRSVRPAPVGAKSRRRRKGLHRARAATKRPTNSGAALAVIASLGFPTAAPKDSSLLAGWGVPESPAKFHDRHRSLILCDRTILSRESKSNAEAGLARGRCSASRAWLAGWWLSSRVDDWPGADTAVSGFELQLGSHM